MVITPTGKKIHFGAKNMRIIQSMQILTEKDYISQGIKK